MRSRCSLLKDETWVTMANSSEAFVAKPRKPVTMRWSSCWCSSWESDSAADDTAVLRFLARSMSSSLERTASLARVAKRAHLIGNHRKTSAGIASTGSLNRSVQSEKVGLEGDLTDTINHSRGIVDG